MSLKMLIIIFIIIAPVRNLFAQSDSVLQSLKNLPDNYLKNTEKKISKYENRISGKTEKTLTKLAKWELKVQKLLQKSNPEAAGRLFGTQQFTFKHMLEHYQNGQLMTDRYKNTYDEFRDKLTTQLKYLDSNKMFLTPSQQESLDASTEKIAELNKKEKQNEILNKMILERKKQLMAEAAAFLSENKHLQKINKEYYYHIQTLKNYKQIFNDKSKQEETARRLLSRIPGFSKYMQENSALASMFARPNNTGSAQNLSGLQTRTTISSVLQNQITLGAPNGSQHIQQELQSGQAELSKFKNKVLESTGYNTEEEMPDFKPNNQKSKTFIQRLEYGGNVQFEKGNSFFPSTSIIGLNVGYKLNDYVSTGVGVAGRIGLGHGWNKIKISGEGIGLRSYLDWKMKKKIYLSIGYEQNYISTLKSIQELKEYYSWNSSALIGVSKEFQASKTKKSKLQVLFDVLAYRQVPRVNPIKIRMGISLN